VVKQQKYRGGFHRPRTILGWLNTACEDARKLTHREAEKRFGLLVISLFDADKVDPRFIESLQEILPRTNYAWHISPASKSAADTFLLFKEVHKKRVPKTPKPQKSRAKSQA